MLPTHKNCYYHVAHHTTLGKSPTSRNFRPAFVIYYGIVYHVIKTKRLPDIIIWLGHMFWLPVLAIWLHILWLPILVTCFGHMFWSHVLVTCFGHMFWSYVWSYDFNNANSRQSKPDHMIMWPSIMVKLCDYIR